MVRRVDADWGTLDRLCSSEIQGGGGMASDRQRGEDASVTIPVLQEELQVGARRVDTGRGVRVHKTVSSSPHTVEQVLEHDELEVRHVPVDRVVAPADAPSARQEGDTYIIPVLEEVLVLEKRVRIREEIHIVRHRRSAPHVETAVLRSEAVTVTPFDDSEAAGPAADRP
jgi:uncharacterized protein (TIGR02271 family)